jgi:hypothetical protein
VYKQKVHDFILSSGAEKSSDNLNNKLKTEVRRAVNDCKHTWNSRQKWKIVNMRID